jgi:hypothetical protein
MLQRLLLITLTLCSLTASAQWQQTGSKVRYVNGLGIPTKDTAAGVAADSSQILIRPADSSLYIKYKRTWVKVGAGGGGTIGGSGTTNYVPKFTAGTTLGNSQLFDDGTNIGMGTTSPVTDLHISKAGSRTIRLTNTSTSTNLELGISTSLGFIGTQSNNAFAINTNNAERIRITSSGNVGINQTTPAAQFVANGTTLINTNTDNGVDKLQVSGNIYSSGTIKSGTLTTNGLEILTGAGKGIIMNTTTTGSQDQMRLTFQQNGSDRALWYYSDFADNLFMGTIANEDMVLGTNNSTRLRVKGGGNILINEPTDNGVDELQVNGSISGIGFKQNYVTKTGAYTATNDDYVIDCTSGTFTVTLPASSGRTGRILIIKNSGAGTITVDGNASETIDGATTYSLSVQYATVQIMSDGTNWKIISKF